MSVSRQFSHPYPFDAVKFRFQFVLAVLFVASAIIAGAQNIQTIYSFTNDAGPNALTLGNDGDFYGTTYQGGSNGWGTIFKVTTNGTFTTLASFSFTNGAYPTGFQKLILGTDGSFYGTTSGGGDTNAAYTYGMGTVFRVTTNGILTTLASFNFTNGLSPNGLTLANDGNFYGTTSGGGATGLGPPTVSSFLQGMGTIFQVTTNGTLTMLASFNFTNGGDPNGLTLGTDGSFYGTANAGGKTNSLVPEGMGTVFRVTTSGTLTALASFDFTNGLYPNGLTLGTDGNFYGTTGAGGIINPIFTLGGMGTIFRLTTNGTLTTLLSFNASNGADPAGLTLGYDSNFYGTTEGGGNANSEYPQGFGTIFQVTANGNLTTLVSLSVSDGDLSGLTLGKDGNFYGTTGAGGITNSAYPQGMGTVFRLVFTPGVTVQPQSQTIYAGETATFSVGARSLSPITFQWQKNGTNLSNGQSISGATNNLLVISAVSDSDAASYSVILSNATGGVSSSNAMLTVNDFPVITTQPTSQTSGLGSAVTFTVQVYGAPPFVFQWYFNQTPLGLPTTGTSFSSYTLTNVGPKQAGNYTVQVINDLGSLTSSNAVLTVIPQPTLALQISAGYALLSLNAILSHNIVVQYSTNLSETNWLNLLSLTNLSTSPYLFLDPAGITQPERFYRAFFTQ